MSDGARRPCVTDGPSYDFLKAAEAGDLADVIALFDHPELDVTALDRGGKSAMHYTCCKGHVQVLELLLTRRDLDVNIRGQGGWTPLMIASYNGRHEAVKMMLQHPDIDVDSANDSKKTAVHYAAVRAFPEVLRMLLSNKPHGGIGINRLAGDDLTPVMSAFSLTGCLMGLEVVRILLRYPGMNLNAGPEGSGETSMSAACCRFEHDRLAPLNAAIVLRHWACKKGSAEVRKTAGMPKRRGGYREGTKAKWARRRVVKWA